FCHLGSIWRDGRVSLWNGQTALKIPPAGVTDRYEPTTATMSLASFTCRVRATRSSDTRAPAGGLPTHSVRPWRARRRGEEARDRGAGQGSSEGGTPNGRRGTRPTDAGGERESFQRAPLPNDDAAETGHHTRSVSVP